MLWEKLFRTKQSVVLALHQVIYESQYVSACVHPCTYVCTVCACAPVFVCVCGYAFLCVLVLFVPSF